jgi:hypothetical protein
MPSVVAMPHSLQSPDRRDPSALEARPPRKRTCLNGKLVYGDAGFMGDNALTPTGAFTLDCTIHNISEGGARIVLSKRQPLPASLYLIVAKYGVVYRADVVWSNFPARGLKFTQTYLFGAVVPEELKVLRRLWVDLCARTSASEP